MTKIAVPNPGALVLPLPNPGKQLGDGGDFAELLGRPPGKASITPIMAFPGEPIRPDPIAPPGVSHRAPRIASALVSPDGPVPGKVTASPLPTLEFPNTDASIPLPASASISSRAVELSAPGPYPTQWVSGGRTEQSMMEVASAVHSAERPQLLVSANTAAPQSTASEPLMAFHVDHLPFAGMSEAHGLPTIADFPSLPAATTSSMRAVISDMAASPKASASQPSNARAAEAVLSPPESPTYIGDSDGVVVEMPVTVPAAVYPNVPVWSRVYPEHLSTNGYLSVIDIQAREGAPSAEPSLLRLYAQPASGLEDADAAFAPDTMPAVSADAVITMESLDAPPRAVDSHTPSDAENFIESLSRSLGPVMAADHAWSERLLRLSRDSQGVSTVWLRDYTLSEADIPPVIEAMKRHAYQEGFAIDRVVINGREVWRAPTTLQGRD